MTPILLQQSLILLASLAVLGVVRRNGRRGALSFVLAAMWLGIAAIGVLAAVLLPNIDDLGQSLGVLPAALFAAAASAILGLIALILSIRVTELEERQRVLAEAVSRLSTSVEGVDAAELGGTLVVVPALNEAASVGSVVRGLVDAGLPVLVVDDGSTDATAAVARAEGANVLSLPFNLGVGGALRTGLGFAVRAGFEQVVQCDADGQHPLESVLGLLDAQENRKVDLLIGSRFIVAGSRRREGAVRFLATLLLARIASRAAGRPITDATSGLRVIRQPLLGELARAMPVHYLGDTFEANVMAGRAGYRIDEFAVSMSPRAFGSSSASAAEAFRLTVRGALVALLRFPGVALRAAPDRQAP